MRNSNRNYITREHARHTSLTLLYLSGARGLISGVGIVPILCTRTLPKRKMLPRQPTARAFHAAVGMEGKLFVWGGKNKRNTIQTATVGSFNISTLREGES